MTFSYSIVGLALTAASMIVVDAYQARRHRAALDRALGDLVQKREPSYV